MPGTIRLTEVHNLGDRSGQQVKRCSYNCQLTVTISWCSQGPTHRVTGDEGPRDAHQLWDMAETANVDTNGWKTCRFEGSLDMPHGHVTHRSNGHQQNNIDGLLFHLFCPLGRDLVLEAKLRRCPDK